MAGNNSCAAQVRIQQISGSRPGFAVDDHDVPARQIVYSFDVFRISARNDNPLLPDCIGDNCDGIFWKLLPDDREVGFAGCFISQVSAGYMDEGTL